MSVHTPESLCICGPNTVVVLLLLIAVTLAYGELSTRFALRRVQTSDRARHRALGFDRSPTTIERAEPSTGQSDRLP